MEKVNMFSPKTSLMKIDKVMSHVGLTEIAICQLVSQQKVRLNIRWEKIAFLFWKQESGEWQAWQDFTWTEVINPFRWNSTTRKLRITIHVFMPSPIGLLLSFWAADALKLSTVAFRPIRHKCNVASINIFTRKNRVKSAVTGITAINHEMSITRFWQLSNVLPGCTCDTCRSGGVSPTD